MKKVSKLKVSIALLCFALGSSAQAQGTGLMPLYKVGVNFHKSIGYELGLLSFNYIPKGTNFLEASISAEGIFQSDFLLVPKLNLEGGTSFSYNVLFMLVGGVNLGLPTDFKKTDFAISPKIGISYGSFIRVYYTHNFFGIAAFQSQIGQNQIGVEINIAAFHNFKIGI